MAAQQEAHKEVPYPAPTWTYHDGTSDGPQIRWSRGTLSTSSSTMNLPDSLMFVNVPQKEFKPLSPNTRNHIIGIRYALLFLRILGFLSAIGILVGGICLKETGTTFDWIDKLPPSVALVHCVYAIYHLSRSPKARTPASTASYMIFASFLDAGILPFMAFLALMSWVQHPNQQNNDLAWQSVFSTNSQTGILIMLTFTASIVLGAASVFALCFSIFLAARFRKIARLPPDLNPFETTLTRRNKPHHNRTKSTATLLQKADPMLKESPVEKIPEVFEKVLSRSESPLYYGRVAQGRGTVMPAHVVSKPSYTSLEHTDYQSSTMTLPPYQINNRTLPPVPSFEAAQGLLSEADQSSWTQHNPIYHEKIRREPAKSSSWKMRKAPSHSSLYKTLRSISGNARKTSQDSQSKYSDSQILDENDQENTRSSLLNNRPGRVVSSGLEDLVRNAVRSRNVSGRQMP